MRPSIIAGNWKMNTTVDEACGLVREMLITLDTIPDVQKILCPPYISLHSIWEITRNTSIKLGAQNMYYEHRGAFTGEISAAMLAGICEYVILGHSERRQIFGETDDMINKKVSKALFEGIKPILCVGECLQDNESGKTFEVISNQLTRGLNGIEPADEIVVAYEPVWAIGSGKAATANQANNTASYIRSRIGEIWGKRHAEKLCILYGGSVTAANICEFTSAEDINGALVGGASLKADEFISIVKQTSNIKSSP
ncbi:MAG TPA: triose-phosphate isomerase [Dehalococcoidia bacterium]|nr:triose-phosphate isomerase [Dehalococcoidia bacterium]